MRADHPYASIRARTRVYSVSSSGKRTLVPRRSRSSLSPMPSPVSTPPVPSEIKKEDRGTEVVTIKEDKKGRVTRIHEPKGFSGSPLSTIRTTSLTAVPGQRGERTRFGMRVARTRMSERGSVEREMGVGTSTEKILRSVRDKDLTRSEILERVQMVSGEDLSKSAIAQDFLRPRNRVVIPSVYRVERDIPRRTSDVHHVLVPGGASEQQYSIRLDTREGRDLARSFNIASYDLPEPEVPEVPRRGGGGFIDRIAKNYEASKARERIMYPHMESRDPVRLAKKGVDWLAEKGDKHNVGDHILKFNPVARLNKPVLTPVPLRTMSDYILPANTGELIMMGATGAVMGKAGRATGTFLKKHVIKRGLFMGKKGGYRGSTVFSKGALRKRSRGIPTNVHRNLNKVVIQETISLGKGKKYERVARIPTMTSDKIKRKQAWKLYEKQTQPGVKIQGIQVQEGFKTATILQARPTRINPQFAIKKISTLREVTRKELAQIMNPKAVSSVPFKKALKIPPKRTPKKVIGVEMKNFKNVLKSQRRGEIPDRLGVETVLHLPKPRAPDIKYVKVKIIQTPKGRPATGSAQGLSEHYYTGKKAYTDLLKRAGVTKTQFKKMRQRDWFEINTKRQVSERGGFRAGMRERLFGKLRKKQAQASSVYHRDFSGLSERLEKLHPFSGLGERLDRAHPFSGLSERLDRAHPFSGLSERLEKLHPFGKIKPKKKKFPLITYDDAYYGKSLIPANVPVSAVNIVGDKSLILPKIGSTSSQIPKLSMSERIAPTIKIGEKTGLKARIGSKTFLDNINKLQQNMGANTRTNVRAINDIASIPASKSMVGLRFDVISKNLLRTQTSQLGKISKRSVRKTPKKSIKRIPVPRFPKMRPPTTPKMPKMRPMRPPTTSKIPFKLPLLPGDKKRVSKKRKKGYEETLYLLKKVSL